MMNIEFNNYCIVVLGEKTEDAEPRINKIAESKPKLLKSKGIVMATFKSALRTNELTEYFKTAELNFLIFEINGKTSGYRLLNDRIENLLFGEYKSPSEIFKNATNNLIKEIKKTCDIENTVKTKVFESKINNDVEYVDNMINNLTPDDAKEMVDKILDKGYNNMTDYDKEVLKKLMDKG